MVYNEIFKLVGEIFGRGWGESILWGTDGSFYRHCRRNEMNQTRNRRRRKNRPKTRNKKGGKIIGTGSYGCVSRPQIPCKGKAAAPGKISKYMARRYSGKEIDEYKKIQAIDPTFEFHLQNPEQCDPDYDQPAVLEEIKGCDIDEIKPIRSYLDIINPVNAALPLPENTVNAPGHTSINIKEFLSQNMTLLVEPDGGNDLSKLEEGGQSKLVILRLLVECRRLFNGVMVMDRNKFNHMDIKPENVVYDMGSNRLNFIDFGLSDFQSEYRSIVDGWNEKKFHYNTVIENLFVLSNKDLKPLGFLPQPVVGKYWPAHVPFFGTDAKGGSVAAFNKFVDDSMTRHFFEKREKDDIPTGEGKVIAERFKRDFTALVKILEKGSRIGPNNEVEKITYDSFYLLVRERVNVYQLGLTMMYILTHVSQPIMAIRKNGRQLYADLRELFYRLMHPNVFERLSSQGPPSILDRYDKILMYYGMIAIVDTKDKKDSSSFIVGPLISDLEKPTGQAMLPLVQGEARPLVQAMLPTGQAILPTVQAMLPPVQAMQPPAQGEARPLVQAQPPMAPIRGWQPIKPALQGGPLPNRLVPKQPFR
jgi:serine/threonine protein kinase